MIIIKYVKSSPYYLHGNGQAEANNKPLIFVLNRIIWEEPKRLAGFLSLALQA